MDNVVPILTGEREDTLSASYWHAAARQAQADLSKERVRRMHAEQVRDAYFDQLCEHADAIAEGRIVTPGMVWARIAFAVFCTALLVWPISRMVP